MFNYTARKIIEIINFIKPIMEIKFQNNFLHGDILEKNNFTIKSKKKSPIKIEDSIYSRKFFLNSHVSYSYLALTKNKKILSHALVKN